MKMRTFTGLCAALAFAAGSTTVHALKIVDNVGDNPATHADARASNTYAKETLLSTATTEASDKSDTTKYYDIAHDNILLSAPADVTANQGDTYVVSYTLDGMVFREKVENVTLTQGNAAGNFTVASGGAEGDKLVVFRLSATGEVAATDTLLVLSAEYAVSAAGSGSVTRTVTNQSIAVLNIPGVDGSMTHTASGAIKLGSGLKETAKATNATATVADSFRSFGGAATARVGSLEVTHNADVRQASGTATGDPVGMLDQVIDNSGTGDDAMSTVSIMGDFSFATKAFLHGDNDCGADPNVTDNADDTTAAAATDILTREGTGDDEMVTGAADQNVTAFATVKYLCIMVDTSEDGMRIPDTVAYTAMGDYAKIDDGAFDPAPMELTLGRIKRDGTTVHLPYLTTNAKFSQRIRVVNRGGDAGYAIDFQSDDTPASIEGTLDAGSVTDFMVGGMDGIIETIGSGKGATAGTIIIEAESSMIDVATIQINKELGTTDTVNYQAEPSSVVTRFALATETKKRGAPRPLSFFGQWAAVSHVAPLVAVSSSRLLRA